MSRTPLRGILAVTLVAATMPIATAVAPSAVNATMSPRSATTPTILTYTGAPQTYQVPANVTQLLVHVVGGSGGSALEAGQYEVTTNGGPGGSVVTTLSVRPFQILQINVGGKGETGGQGPIDNDFTVSDPDPGPAPHPGWVRPARGGWNGGGNAGFGTVTYGTDYETALYGTYAGGGGGATDIRVCDTALTALCPLGTRVVVAGGGGGAGMNAGLGGQFVGTSLPGGAGGALSNGSGNAGPGQSNLSSQYAGGGGGATPSAGGSGGTSAITSFTGTYQEAIDCKNGANSGNGYAGTLGKGGAGGSGPPANAGFYSTNFGGAGGGGGYYGGGGGGCGGFAWVNMEAAASQVWFPGTAAGGGGSSWTDASVTSNTTFSTTSLQMQHGYVVIQGVKFGANGAAQTFTVPNGVNTLSVSLAGGQGGLQGLNSGSGRGASINGTMAVTPGQSLNVNVGGGGQRSQCQGGSCPMSSLGAAPGFATGLNGGGLAVPLSYTSGWAGQSGGGGATDIRLGGTALTDRVAVAAGGGGSTISDPDFLNLLAAGGIGGCILGGGGSGDTDGDPGSGATFTGGGGGGGSGPSGSYDGAAGLLGAGGAGGQGDATLSESRQGGGGGGGYYGGGGGGGGGSTVDIAGHSAGAGGGGNSHIDPSLTGLTCTAGTGPQSGQVQVGADGFAILNYQITVPGIPTQPIATADGATGATLTWTQDITFGTNTGSVVQQSTNGTTWSTASGTFGAATATVTGLDASTNYQFRIASVNASGQGPWSRPTRWIRTGKTVPGTPGTPTATPWSNSLQVSWTAPSSDGGSPVLGYAIRYSSNNGANWTEATTDTQSTTTTYSLGGLTSANSYIVQVAAVNVEGTGAWSSSSSPSATPIGIPTAPGTPAGTRAFERINLSWTAATVAGTQSVTDYEVRLSPDNGTTWFAPVSTGSTTPTYIIAPLQRSLGYLAQVRALNGDAVGPWSASSAAITPQTRSFAPTAVRATAGDNSVALTWTAPTNNGGGTTVGYHIEKRDQLNPLNTWQTAILDTNSTATSATISQLTNGARYSFRVASITAVTGAETADVLGAYSRATIGVTPRSSGGGGSSPVPVPLPNPSPTPTSAPTTSTPSAKPLAPPLVYAVSTTHDAVRIAVRPRSTAPVTFQQMTRTGRWVDIEGATVSRRLTADADVRVRIRSTANALNSAAVRIRTERSSIGRPIPLAVTFAGSRSTVISPDAASIRVRIPTASGAKRWVAPTRNRIELPALRPGENVTVEVKATRGTQSTKLHITINH